MVTRNQLSWQKLSGLTVAALLLSTFPFFGAPLVRVLRSCISPWRMALLPLPIFGVLHFAGAQAGPDNIGLLALAAQLLGVWWSVLIFAELEERGWGTFWSIVVLAALFSGLSLAYLSLFADVTGFVAQMDMQLKAAQGADSLASHWLTGLTIDGQFIVRQSFSIFTIIFGASLALGLMMERRLAVLLGVSLARPVGRISLRQFRVPESLIWLLILSFTGAFLDVELPLIKDVSMNVFNILGVCYFFQGLVVLNFLLDHYQFGPWFRLFVYLILVGQFFPIVSLLGIADYWVDFKKRLLEQKMKV